MTAVKRSPMDLYRERSTNNQCTRCGIKHSANWNLKKCPTCRASESKYRKETRDDRRKNQERDYQRKNWPNRCLYLSKNADRRKDRTSDEPYITPQRLVTLRILQDNKCYYCDTELQVQNRKKPDGLTIERINNSKPHTISNVILCCHRCNCKKLSNKITTSTFEIFYKICNKFLESEKCKQLLSQMDTL